MRVPERTLTITQQNGDIPNMRVFKIYSFQLSKKTSIMGSTLDLATHYMYKNIIFEITHIREPNGVNVYDLDVDKIVSVAIPNIVKKMPFVTDYLFKYCQPRSDEKECTILWTSNLNQNWMIPNPTGIVRSISAADACTIEKLFRNSHVNHHTWLIGFDEISWFGNTVSLGTYGYEKAKNWLGGGGFAGFNYLSNSIILSEDLLNKDMYLYVSVEVTPDTPASTPKDDAPILKYITSIFGDHYSKSLYYAPSTEEERNEWSQKKEQLDSVFNIIKHDLPEMISALPNTVISIDHVLRYENEIPSRRLWQKEFKGSNWEYLDSEFVFTDKSGCKSYLSLVTQDYGHRCTVYFRYLGPMFDYAIRCLDFTTTFLFQYFDMQLMEKEEIIQYFENIHILFDRIINTLSDEVLRVYGHVPDWYYREHD